MPIFHERRIAKLALNAAKLPKVATEFEEIAAGVGLTMTAANHVIHLERHGNPAKEGQATDRVYRIGQTRDVLVQVPILLHPERASYDVNLDKILRSKMRL